MVMNKNWLLIEFFKDKYLFFINLKSSLKYARESCLLGKILEETFDEVKTTTVNK